MRSLIFLLILVGINLSAQEIIIVDSITGLPIEGASIVSGKEKAAKTSSREGKLSVSEFSDQDTLIIRHLSYQEKQKIKSSIKNKKISLLLTPHPLDEIKVFEPKTIDFKSSLSHLKIKEALILESQSAQTSELLEKSMGISIQNSQNGGGSPNLRGMEANRLLLIIDGIPLNNTIFRSGHVQSASTINPIFLEKAEVLFGPASVAYGDGAMGGAILFNTKIPKNKNASQFIQQYESSSNAVFTSIISNYQLKKSLHISGFSIKSYSDLKMGSNRIHGFNTWGREAIITENNTQKGTGYQQADFLHKTLFKVSKNNFLLFNSQFSTSSNINRFDKLNDIENGSQKYKYWYYGPRKRFSQNIRLKNYHKGFFSDEKALIASYQNITESRHKQKKEDLFLNNRVESLHIIDFKSNFLKKFKYFKLNYGFDSRFETLTSEATLSNRDNFFYNTTRYPDGGTRVLNSAIYSQFNLKCTKKILMLAGSRYNINSLIASFKDTSTIHLPFNNISVQNKAFSNSLTLIYNLHEQLLLNSTISNGYRNPNTDDVGKVFSKNDVSVIVPNNKLSPEKSLTLEIGLKLTIGNLLSVELQGFQTEISDAIERRRATLNGLDSIFYDGEMMMVMKNINIGSATIQGVNFRYQINMNKHFSHNTIINFIRGKTWDNLPLAHIPPTNIISAIKYNHKNHFFEVSGHYNGLKSIVDYDLEGVDNLEEATEIGTPSWYTINLKYQTKFSEDLSFIAGIYNIIDIHYKTFGSGISASGRNFSLGLHCKF